MNEWLQMLAVEKRRILRARLERSAKALRKVDNNMAARKSKTAVREAKKATLTAKDKERAAEASAITSVVFRELKKLGVGLNVICGVDTEGLKETKVVVKAAIVKHFAKNDYQGGM